MSVADAEIDGLCEAIATVLQPRGRIVRTIEFSVVFLFFYAAALFSCHWNRYSPGKLMVAIDVGQSHALHSVFVPGGQRAVVEEALRRLGKWDEGSGVAFESGLSINLSV